MRTDGRNLRGKEDQKGAIGINHRRKTVIVRRYRYSGIMEAHRYKLGMDEGSPQIEQTEDLLYVAWGNVLGKVSTLRMISGIHSRVGGA